MARSQRIESVSRQLAVLVIPIGSGCVAATRIGGATIRTGRHVEPIDAVRELFRILASGAGDSGIAVDLWMEDADIGDEINRLLGDGSSLPSSD